MKKFFLGLLLIISILSLGFSQNINILTFDSAVNFALQNNKDFLIAKINLENTLHDYETKKKDPTTLILSLKQAELNAKLERLRFNNTRLQVIQSVRNAYFSVLEAKAQLRLLQKQLELSKEQLEAVKIKFQLGNATSLDVQQAEINYLTAQNNLRSGMNSLNISWGQFWETLGIAPMENVELQELPLITLNLKFDELFSIAQENLTSIVQAKNNVELYELQVKLYDNEYTPKSQLISAKNSLESAKITLTQTLSNARITISQRLDQLNLGLENLNIENKNLELAKENYRVSNIRFSAGLIAKLDLINSEINIIKAENSYYSALHTYWKNLDNLSLAVGKALYEKEESKK